MAYNGEPLDGHYYLYDVTWMITQLDKYRSDITDLQTRLASVEDEIKGLPVYVQELVLNQANILRAQINQQLAEQDRILASMKLDIDNTVELVRTLTAQYTQLSSTIAELMTFIEVYTDQIGEQTYQRLKSLVDEWSKNLPPIICPVDGKTEGIQTVIDHVFEAVKRGVTANNFDTLEITAEAYDSLQILALEYDVYGRDFLNRVKDAFMNSPFTGEYVPVSDVINMLANLHKDGLTATEFDALALSATAYDNKKWTAYYYDWQAGTA